MDFDELVAVTALPPPFSLLSVLQQSHPTTFRSASSFLCFCSGFFFPPKPPLFPLAFISAPTPFSVYFAFLFAPSTHSLSAATRCFFISRPPFSSPIEALLNRPPLFSGSFPWFPGSYLSRSLSFSPRSSPLKFQISPFPLSFCFPFCRPNPQLSFLLSQKPLPPLWLQFFQLLYPEPP